MVIRETKDQQNNLYSIVLTTEFDSRELSFMQAYGEPKVEVGGEITYNTSFTFVKAPNQVLMRSQFPVTFALNGLTDPVAVAKVNAWSLAVRTHLETALTTLLSNPDPVFPLTTVFPFYYVDGG